MIVDFNKYKTVENFLSQKGANENMRSYTLKVTLTLQNKLMKTVLLSHLRLDQKIVDSL